MNKIGVSFPFRSDEKGSVEYSWNLINSIEDNLKQIIFTRKGERRMNPEFGCDIWKVVFEYDIVVIREMVREYITEPIQRYEPRIELLDVDTQKHEEYIDINLTYNIKNSNLPVRDINIPYYRN